jgi:hypothetical protein
MVNAIEPLLDLPASSVKEIMTSDSGLLKKAWSFYRDEQLREAGKQTLTFWQPKNIKFSV